MKHIFLKWHLYLKVSYYNVTFINIKWIDYLVKENKGEIFFMVYEAKGEGWTDTRGARWYNMGGANAHVGKDGNPVPRSPEAVEYGDTTRSKMDKATRSRRIEGRVCPDWEGVRLPGCGQITGLSGSDHLVVTPQLRGTRWAEQRQEQPMRLEWHQCCARDRGRDICGQLVECKLCCCRDIHVSVIICVRVTGAKTNLSSSNNITY